MKTIWLFWVLRRERPIEMLSSILLTINGFLVGVPKELGAITTQNYFSIIPDFLFLIGMCIPGMLWPIITVFFGESKARIILLVQASIWAAIGLGFLTPETSTGFTTYTVIAYFAYLSYQKTQSKVRNLRREEGTWRSG